MEQDFSRLDALLQEYEGRKGSLIPFLQAAQELEGYLSRPALKYISERMKVPAAEICGVVTFYSMFRLEPQGKHIIRVCKGTACYVSEADGIKDALIENLKLEDGKLTTDDPVFGPVIAFGRGGTAVEVIDDKTLGKLTPEAIPRILEKFRNGEA